MRQNVDTLLVINNERLREITGNLSFTDAFAKADDILATAAKGIAEVIEITGAINVDFNDVMAFYQAFISGQANNDSYDFNGDGAINFFDIRALMAMCSRAGCAV